MLVQNSAVKSHADKEAPASNSFSGSLRALHGLVAGVLAFASVSEAALGADSTDRQKDDSKKGAIALQGFSSLTNYAGKSVIVRDATITRDPIDSRSTVTDGSYSSLPKHTFVRFNIRDSAGHVISGYELASSNTPSAKPIIPNPGKGAVNIGTVSGVITDFGPSAGLQLAITGFEAKK